MDRDDLFKKAADLKAQADAARAAMFADPKNKEKLQKFKSLFIAAGDARREYERASGKPFDLNHVPDVFNIRIERQYDSGIEKEI